MDRMTDRQRNEYTPCAGAGGTFFPVVVLCQFLVLAGNRFWFYILMYLEYNTVVVLCCRKPPRYVPYKGTYVTYDGTYGTSDLGQMLDV